MTNEALILEAKKAREKSYSPYSHFQVGAALLGKSGKVYHGCNIENAAYPATNCAERTALYSAVAQGEQSFCAIAIVGGLKNSMPKEYCYPCGICRQVLSEFCDADTFRVIVAKSEEDYEEFYLKDLLPHGSVL